MAKDIDKKIEKVKKIYAKYLKDLAFLKKKQNLIISNFIKEIEQKKIEEIKKLLSNQ